MGIHKPFINMYHRQLRLLLSSYISGSKFPIQHPGCSTGSHAQFSYMCSRSSWGSAKRPEKQTVILIGANKGEGTWLAGASSMQYVRVLYGIHHCSFSSPSLQDIPIWLLSLNFLFSAGCDINFTVSGFQYRFARDVQSFPLHTACPGCLPVDHHGLVSSLQAEEMDSGQSANSSLLCWWPLALKPIHFFYLHFRLFLTSSQKGHLCFLHYLPSKKSFQILEESLTSNWPQLQMEGGKRKHKNYVFSFQSQMDESHLS